MQIATRFLTRLMAAGLKTSVVAGNYSGPILGAYAGLATAIAPPPSPDSVRADVTEATITGYARKAITWATATDSSNGYSELLSGLLTWTPSDAVNPNTIAYIVYFDALTNGNLLGIDILPTPIPLPTQFTSLNYVAAMGLLFAGNYDPGVVIP